MSKRIKNILIYQRDKSSYGAAGDNATRFLVSKEHRDEMGRTIALVTLNQAGAEEERTLRTYDASDRLVEEVVEHVLIDTIDKRVIRYNDVERTSEEVQYYGDDPGEKTVTRFDDKGHVIELAKYDGDTGELISLQRFGYNEKGLPSLDEEYDEDETLVKRTVTLYDDTGRMIRQEVSFPHAPDDNHVVTFHYEEGKTTEEARSAEGQLFYSQVAVLDDRGRETEVSRWNEFDSGDSWRETYEYDDQGHVLLREHYSGAGDLLYRYQLTYEDGLLSEEGRFLTPRYVGEARHTIRSFEYEFYD